MSKDENKFEYLIKINPLGFLYGSMGAFLSPENLVGRSGSKFPPDSATLSGVFFKTNQEKPFTQDNIKHNLFIAGPFWAKNDDPEYFYVPIPWHKVIADDGVDEWKIVDHKWYREETETENGNKRYLEPDYRWQKINYWDDTPETIKSNGGFAKAPWEHISILHPRIQDNERCVLKEDGLFLENAVQMDDEFCLIYLSSHSLPDGWYRFGGENHIVEITSIKLDNNSLITELLEKPIEKAFALITPGLWGSNHLSYRYPIHPDFPKKRPKMLTDRPIPYRYRAGNKLSRGRYAVPPGTVYVFDQAIDKNWYSWSEDWFPKEGFSLKILGCNLCLPVNIEGVTQLAQ